MEEIINKRKIKSIKTLNGKFLHKKMTNSISAIEVEKSEEINKEEIQENNKLSKKETKFKISPFQLVVIKLPWYKRAVRSLMSFLGLYYEF